MCKNNRNWVISREAPKNIGNYIHGEPSTTKYPSSLGSGEVLFITKKEYDIV